MRRLLHNVSSIIVILVIFGGWSHYCFAQNDAPAKKVFVIPISGDVEPAMASYLKRVLKDIPDTAETIIVIEMDTFGGRVDSAFEMVDTLTNIKNAQTIAFVTNKAISAGSLISLACKQLVMKHGTTIGDCAPILNSNEGPKMMGEKFQSPLRAKFRALAKRNGYPTVLAEAMVTADMEVYRITLDGDTRYMDEQEFQDLSDAQKKRISEKKTVVSKGELLTMDDAEAHELGFSQMSVENIEQMLTRMDISGYKLTRIKWSWSEQLVRIIGTISPILMIVGLGALYTEIKAPGFGAPGIIGILCLALVFFNQYLVGLATYTELLIIVIGLILLGFEMFVFPGFGISGIAGIICITVGMLLSFQDFVIPDPKMPWEKELLIHNLLMVLSSLLASFLLALFVLRYIFPRLSIAVSGPYLATTLADARVDVPEEVSVLTGKTGTALTQLRPSGKAKIDGEVYDVVTQGDFISKNAPIKVVNVKNNRIIVLQVDTDE